MKKSNLKKLTVTAILAAVAVVGSLFSFPVFGSKCAPVQHLVNILCAVTVGPWWALAQAFIASLIRNLLGLGSPLAFPGSMCGALLGGLLYKYGKKLPFAYIGEVVGTGIIGGMLSYPVAYLVMGNKAAALFTFVVPFLISTCGGTIIAIIIGCLSGYFGGWVDMLLMRITEIFSSIPFLPFAMMLSYVIRTMPIGETVRIFIIMIMLGLLSWTGLARMIRAQVLAEREKEFVLAAKSMGVKENRIAFKHILPNVISIILVNVTLDFASCMLTESSLSYLGFGVQQPQPTWGNMLYGANNSIVIQNYWWQWVFPAIFLAVATISINIIGDTLRDVLDPKSSQEK